MLQFSVSFAKSVVAKVTRSQHGTLVQTLIVSAVAMVRALFRGKRWRTRFQSVDLRVPIMSTVLRREYEAECGGVCWRKIGV